MHIFSGQKIIKFLKLIIPFAFYSLLIIFLVKYFRDLDFSLIKAIIFEPLFLILSVFTGLLSRYWSAYIWLTILKSLGAKNLKQVSQLTYVYSKAWLGRYIPGAAPWILGKIYFASKHGVSKNKLAISSLLEAGLQVLVMTTFASVLLIFDARIHSIDSSLKSFMLLVIVAGLFVLSPPVFNKLIGFAYYILKKGKLNSGNLVGWKTIGKGASLYMVGSIFTGLSLFFIAKSVYPELEANNIPFLIGSTSLATSLSMLAFFAPGGIGVREGVQLILLPLILPKELALVIVVTTRIWSISLDLLFFLTTSVRLKVNNRSR